MSDLTVKILTDRNTYPDDMEITMADGQKITVKDFRDSTLPKGDFTRATEKWATRERELQAALDGTSQQLAAAMEAKAAVAPPASPAATGQYTEADLRADPAFRLMFERHDAAAESLKAHEARLVSHENAFLRDRFNNQLESFSTRHNARFNSDGRGKAFDQKEFLDYVQKKPLWTNTNGNPELDLETSYSNWTRTDEIAQIISEAEARGVERGKAAARVPAVPFGRRRTPTKAAGLPETFQAVKTDDIENDPEIQAAMQADAG